MGRILAIDYGLKRTGIAVTDEGRIIATALTTVETPKLMTFLVNYCSHEQVDIFVVGDARHLNNTPSQSAQYIEPFVKQLQKRFPQTKIDRMDERFTSKMALQSMIDSGLGKKQRQNKAFIDAVSATIILQSYMDRLRLATRNNDE